MPSPYVVGSIAMTPTPTPPRHHRSASGPRRCAALVALLVATGACSASDEGERPAAPLIIEPGPAQVTERLDLDIPLDETGFFQFSSWPPACDLLTDAQITTVLPQVQTIERTSMDEDIQIIGSGQTATVANAICRYELDIPEAGLGIETSPPTIQVRIDAAGTPEVAQRNFMNGSDTPVQVPSGECYVAETLSGVSCLKGPLVFSVTSRFAHQQIGSDTWTDRYRVGGETTTFTGEIGGEDTESFVRAEVFRRDALDVELAKVILAKF